MRLKIGLKSKIKKMKMKNNNNHIVWMWLQICAVGLGVLLFLAGMVMDLQNHPASENLTDGGILLIVLGFVSIMMQVTDVEI